MRGELATAWPERWRPRVAAGLAVAALAADAVIWPALAPFGAVPDANLAVALALAVTGQERPAVVLALGAGLLRDGMEGYLVGLGAAARGAGALLAGFVHQRTPAEGLWVVMGAAGAGLVADGVVSHLGAWAFGVPLALSWWRLVRGLVGTLLTLAIFAMAYASLSWVRLGSPARSQAVGRGPY